MAEFLVELDVDVPAGTPAAETAERERAETAAAAELAREGHLVRLWRRPGDTAILGLYRAAGDMELYGMLGALPLSEWMHVSATPLEPHADDPAAASDGLPAPRLMRVYRLEAALAEPLELGDVGGGRRRIVPLAGGTFTGPEISGTLVPGGSADWQTVLPDGTALGDIRYTLRTDAGALLDVRSRGVRHGPPDVLARLGRGEDVDPGQYTFRTSTRIETGAPGLDWLNTGVFVGVAARRPGGVIYETYLVA